MSFNYDVVFDLAAMNAWYGSEWEKLWEPEKLHDVTYGWKRDAGLRRVQAAGSSPRIIKPNGSITWEGSVRPGDSGLDWRGFHALTPSVYRNTFHRIEGSPLLSEPLIALPHETTFAQMGGESEASLFSVLKNHTDRALQRLTEEDCLLSIGFSFRGTDPTTRLILDSARQYKVTVGVVDVSPGIVSYMREEGIDAVWAGHTIRDFLSWFRKEQ